MTAHQPPNSFEAGVIAATIDQEPGYQGSKPLDILFNAITNGPDSIQNTIIPMLLSRFAVIFPYGQLKRTNYKEHVNEKPAIFTVHFSISWVVFFWLLASL